MSSLDKIRFGTYSFAAANFGLGILIILISSFVNDSIAGLLLGLFSGFFVVSSICYLYYVVCKARESMK